MSTYLSQRNWVTSCFLFLLMWGLGTGFALFMGQLGDRDSFDSASDTLMMNAFEENPTSPLRGWLVMPDGDANALPHQSGGWLKNAVNEEGKPVYLRQYGLKSQVWTTVMDFNGWSVNQTAKVMKFSAAIGYAGLVAALFAFFGWYRSYVSSVVGFGILLCMPSVWQWASSLYWPAFGTMCLFAWALVVPTRKPALYLSGIFIIAAVRMMQGYEYLTCLSLGAVTMAMINVWARGEKHDVKKYMGIWVVTVVAFFAAFTLHLYRVTTLGASWAEALNVIVETAKYRTVRAPSWAEDTSLFRGIASAGGAILKHGVLAITFIYILVGVRISLRPSREENYNFSVLWLIGCFGLVASLSWQVLAFGHARFHPHLNSVVMVQPFLFVVAFYFGDLAGRLWPQRIETVEL